jgi:type I restriction enzyme S subunit
LTQTKKKYFIKYASGSTFLEISHSEIGKTKCAIPCAEEQNKIAQFLSLIDERIEIQNKIISHYETLIKGLCDNIFKHHKTDCLFNLVKCKSSTLQENEVKMSDDGQYNVFGASGIIATTENYQFDESAILVLKDGSKAGKIQYASGMYSVVGTSVILIPNDSRDTRYIYFAMMAIDFEKYKVGSGIPHIYFKDYSAEKIYYPDAKQRERIAKTLDTYETKINIEKGMLSALQKQKAFLLQSMFI